LSNQNLTTGHTRIREASFQSGAHLHETAEFMAESQKNQARGESPTLADQIASQLQDTKHPTRHMGSKPT
jgi:hypothetical protein